MSTSIPPAEHAEDTGALPAGSRKSKRSKKSDLYSEVTDKIIAQMEEGCVPWVQPWGRDGVKTPLGLPSNAATGNTYSGINILLLWDAAIETRRSTQTWLTFKQALNLGGCVRKGEQGTKVCYADTFIPKEERDRAKETGDNPQPIGFLKR